MSGARKLVEDLHFENAVKHITSAATATYTLTPQERSVRVLATNDSGNITIKLQPEDVMIYAIVSVKLVTFDTSNVLVADRHGSTLATLDTSGDDVVLYSDGYEWHLIGGTYT